MSHKILSNRGEIYMWKRNQQMFRKHEMPVSKSSIGMVWNVRSSKDYYPERYYNFSHGQCYVSMYKNRAYITFYDGGDILVLE